MKHVKKRRLKKSRLKNRGLIKRRIIFAVFTLTLTLFIIGAAIGWHQIYENVFLKAAYPQKYSDIVIKYAKENGLDPNLVFAVIRTESSFNPNATSQIGAMGLMQITPPTFEWAMDKTPEKENYTDEDLFTPKVNIQYGTIVLSNLITEFGNEETALAAYNAGRNIVRKWLTNAEYSKDGKTLSYIPFTETRTYVIKVEESKKIYIQLYKNSNSNN